MVNRKVEFVSFARLRYFNNTFDEYQFNRYGLEKGSVLNFEMSDISRSPLWRKPHGQAPFNNNNSQTMFIVLSSWQSHCESSPVSFDECRTAPSGRRPKTKPEDFGWVRLYTSLHPPSPFIIITQPKAEGTHFTVPGRVEPSVWVYRLRHSVASTPQI